MRQIIFNSDAFEEFVEWSSINKSIFLKISKLIKEIQRNPFEGIGEPEPLKYQFQGCWSRHITSEHRLIYKITEDCIRIISCKHHYKG
jgi:toxin YoeB